MLSRAPKFALLLPALAAVALLGGFQAAVAEAAPAGTLDRDFAGDGRKLIDALPQPGIPSNRDDQAYAIGVHRGRILLAGRGGGRHMTVVRLLPRGKLDPSFGRRGRRAVRPFNRAFAVAFQQNDRILLAGRTSSGFYGLARLRPDGRLDDSFGGDGKVSTRLVGSEVLHRVLDLAIQDNGKILAVGVANDFDDSRGPSDLALVRYRRNGQLDPSFGDGGAVVTDFGTDARTAGNGVAIQPDGRIVVAGEVQSNWIAARFMPDGSPDPSFDDDGIRFTAPLAIGWAEDVAIQPDGRILTAGCETGGDRPRFGLVRYLADGTPDPSFDGDGVQHEASFGSRFRGGCASSMALQRDGKIVLAGSAEKPDRGGDLHFAVARYLPTGAMDPTFSRNGTAVTGFRQRLRGNSTLRVDDYGTGVALQGRRILVGGYSQAVERSDDFAIAAFRR